MSRVHLDRLLPLSVLTILRGRSSPGWAIKFLRPELEVKAQNVFAQRLLASQT